MSHILLILWFILTEFRLVSPIFLPKLNEIGKAFWVSIQNGVLIKDTLYTLFRMLIGFFIAIILGVPIGLLMGYNKKVYHSLEFIVEFFRSIPATALFPLFLLIFGIGDSVKISVSAWSAGLIIILNSMYGVYNAKALRVRAAKVMNLKPWDMFWKVIFMEALPQIFTGLRIGISLSLIVVIVSEMFIGTNVGLGHRIIDSQLVYKIDDMYTAIFMTGVIGFSLNKLLIKIEKKIIHWNGL